MTITKSLGAIVVRNTVSIAESFLLSADPTFVGNLAGSASAGQEWRMDGTTGKSITKAWHGLVTLVAGVATLDLTALTGDPSGTISMSGLKLRLLHIVAASTNTHPFILAPGASNGYTGWVGADGIILNANDPILQMFNGGIPVDGTHKIIDVTGDLVESAVVILGFGP